MSEFKQPDVLPVTDKIYRLDEDYSYCWIKNSIENRISIPAGFRYDGASVPRLLWTITSIRRDGLIRAAALVHDWIYIHAGRLPEGSHQYKVGGNWVDVYGRWKRKQADLLFARLMREADYSKTKRRLAYLAVRVFGRFSWDT